MEQDQRNSRVRLMIIGVAILVVMLVGVTYAFFNYTRTGGENTVRTGRINFLSNQANALTLTQVFPMTSSEAANAELDQVSIRIEGDTTYAGGEEFEITIVDVSNTVGVSSNEKIIPISYIATYTPTASGDAIGSAAVSDYYTERGHSSTVYELTSEGEVSNGKQVLVGYIPQNGEIDGTLKISAYLDSSKIAITDTYPEEVTDTNNDGALDGTTSSWVGDRVVLTTTEWNALTSTPLSFKIRVESNEDTWVEEQNEGAIPSCPDCKFIYSTTQMDTTWNIMGQTPSVLTSGLYDNYEELIATTGNNYFLGVKLNSNNEVTNAYACGVKNDIPFCIEGTSNGASYSDNQTLLQGANLYNNTCSLHPDSETGYGYDYVECGPWDNSGSLSAAADSFGNVRAGVGNSDNCTVYHYGYFECNESGSGG